MQQQNFEARNARVREQVQLLKRALVNDSVRYAREV